MHAPQEPPPPRRPAPTAVGCLAAVIALLSVGTVAGAGVTSAFLRQRIGRERALLQAELEERLRVRDELADADAVIREVALYVRMERAERGEFPRRPDEALPDDPWGTPLEYERIHPQHVRIRSAGPDRRFGTTDDLEEVVE